MTEHRPQSNSKLRGQNKSRGQGLVEFSLILPILLFLILGIIDYGRILLVFANSSTAIRDAARNATLLSTDATSGLPRYIACDRIYNTADDILFATDIEVNVVYFNTPDNPDLATNPTQLSDIAAAMAAVNPDGGGRDFTGADFDCPPPGTYANSSQMSAGANPLPDVGEDDVSTGDIMVVTLDAEIEFITPILASLFPTIELNFRTQRTIITRLLLTPTGLDRDFDGLLDSYELAWFGCMLEDYETVNRGTDPVIIRPNDWLYSYDESAQDVFAIDTFNSGVDPYTYTTTNDPYPQDATDTTPTTNANADYDNVLRPPTNSTTYNGNCATEDLIYDASVAQSDYALLGCDVSGTWPPADNVVQDCIVPNTVEFTATSDPDGDGCNNGCEAARGTNTPIYLGGYVSPDTDGDGLLDGFEIGIGTDPTVADSDGDGLWDGQEVCPEGYDPSTLSDTTRTCDPNLTSDPTLRDTDNDGIEDPDEINGSTGFITDPSDSDSDNDGIDDNTEINGGEIVIPNIDGFPNISFFVGAGVLDPTDGSDSDGDGITDRVEHFEGYLITNEIDGTDVRVFSNPASADTDGDGVSDGPNGGDEYLSGATLPTGTVLPVGVQDINPTKSDTDGDGLDDGQEQIDFGTRADNTNSDGVLSNGNGLEGNCVANGVPQAPLDDYFEMVGFVSLYGMGSDTNIDGDALVNALDDDSDGDGLSDCQEFYFYSTNPYSPDSDGDGYTDDVEIAPENFCLNPNVDDSPVVTEPCGTAVDSDNDDLDDAWENAYNGGDLNALRDEDGSGTALDDDPDNDLCDNECELARNTDPLDPDTDDDYIRDGVEIGSNPNNDDTDNDGIIDGYEACSDLSWAGWSVAPETPPTGTCAGTDVIDDDTDNDGLLDGSELGTRVIVINGVNTTIGATNPLLADTDGDGLIDGVEVLGINVANTFDYINVSPAVSNQQVETSSGTSSINLNTVQSNPLVADSDGDGLNDDAELYLHSTLPNDSDTDDDGIPDGSVDNTRANRGELGNTDNPSFESWGTDPHDFDSDGDGLTDNDEIYGNATLFNNRVLENYTNASINTPTNTTFSVNLYDETQTIGIVNNFLVPTLADSDGDGISDGDELIAPAGATVAGAATSNPNVRDTDEDGIPDGTETTGTPATNPRDYGDPGGASDTDGDGLSTDDENNIHGTDPADPDTDNDGLEDGLEVTPITINYGINGAAGSDTTIQLIAVDTNTSNSIYGYGNGYDSDGDGLADGFETYWFDVADAANFASDFTAPSGWVDDTGTCAYFDNNTVTQQALNGLDSDTDDDGIGDGYECNIIETNPFDDGETTTLLSQIDNTDGLRTSATLTTLGTLESYFSQAYVDLGAAGFTLDAEGRVLVAITRSDTGFVGALLAATCGPAWNGSAMEATEPCGIREADPATETNNAGGSDDIINAYIAPSAIVELLANDTGNDIVSIQLPSVANLVTVVANDIDPPGNNNWSLSFNVTVQDANNQPVVGATVSTTYYTIDGNAVRVNRGQISCVTGAGGTCAMTTAVYATNGQNVRHIETDDITLDAIPSTYTLGTDTLPSPCRCSDPF